MSMDISVEWLQGYLWAVLTVPTGSLLLWFTCAQVMRLLHGEIMHLPGSAVARPESSSVRAAQGQADAPTVAPPRVVDLSSWGVAPQTGDLTDSLGLDRTTVILCSGAMLWPALVLMLWPSPVAALVGLSLGAAWVAAGGRLLATWRARSRAESLGASLPSSCAGDGAATVRVWPPARRSLAPPGRSGRS